jgi:hypothetical protein
LSFFLKKGYLLSIISFLSIIGTWTFKSVCKDTFEQSYNDAALLQTSELDGWKVDDEMPYMERERYRKWIVDCHKASYVPVCVIAEDDYLTSEPAVVLPTQKETDNESEANGADSYESRDQSSNSSVKLSGRQRSSTVDSYNSFASLSQKNVQSQRGAIFRRVTGSPMLNFGDTSFILEEGETNGSPTRIFPRQIMKTVSDHDLNEESREKLL